MGRVKAVVLLGLCALATLASALTRTEVEEIRRFASKAYGGKGPEIPDSRAAFSHYVGKRMKPLTVAQPYTVFMKPASRRPFFEPMTSGAVNSYSFVPYRHPNFLAPPPPSYTRPYQSHPPPPPTFRFGGGPSFSYGFPPLGPPTGFSKRPPPPQVYRPYTGPVVPVRNGPPQVQVQHDQRIQTVTTHKHQFNVQGAQVGQIQNQEKVKGNEIKATKEVKKVPEEVKPSKQQGNIKSNEVNKVTQTVSYAPQTYETIPHEVYTRHYQYGPVVPAVMEDPLYPIPIRYEHVTPMTFQYRPQAQPMHMTTVYQSQAYPEYTFHSGPNHNFMRFQSFLQAPSVVPIVASLSQSPKPYEGTNGSSEVTTASSEVAVAVPTPIPSNEVAPIVFESARIPEDVARRPGGSSHSRPSPMTPQEQRNVFTAAADSSMVVAPLVYSQNSVSPQEKTSTSGPVQVIEKVIPEVTSTSRSVSRSRQAEGVSSTVTKVLPGGKRVRLRKVRVSPKDKVEPFSSSSS